ncbi:MAG: mechanosensitive ion channel domain-containing protein [Pseudomonadota bacterium]
MKLKTLFLALFWSALVWASAPEAQTVPVLGSDTVNSGAELPDPLTPEVVRDLVSRMSDEEVRALLLERLDAVADKDAKAEEVPGAFSYVGQLISETATAFATEVAVLPRFGEPIARAWQNFLGGRSPVAGIWVLVQIVIAIALGQLAQMGAKALTRGARDRLAIARPDGFVTVAKWYAARFGLDFFTIVVFTAVSIAVVLLALGPGQDLELAIRSITLIAGMGKTAWAIERIVSSVDRPDIRVMAVDDFWSSRIGTFFQIGIIIWVTDQIGSSALMQYGVSLGESRFGYWMTLLLYVFTISAILSAREGFRQAIVGRDGLMGPVGLRIASVWSFIIVALLAGNWIVIDTLARAGRFDLISGQQNVTLTLILCAAIIDTALRSAIVAFTPDMQGEGRIAERAYLATKKSWLRIGRVVLICAVFILISEMWDIDLVDAAGGAVGQQVTARLLNFLITIFLGYLVWELISLWTNRLLARELTEAGIDLDSDEPAGGDGGGAGLSRLATVLPILRLVASVVIWVVTGLVALSELGVDTTPLLAGSAIVGLAIGFGAQALVKDVVGGIFFLIDDAFRMGEYIMIGETKGTVEKIALRSLQLRHHLGAVHTVPYGEIPQVTNHSRDWVMMKLKFTFPFETDANVIKKIFKKIGAEMQEAYYAGDLLQTWKSQGVIDVDDVGVVIRGKFMAKPGAQWVIRKDVYNRVQKAIEAAGIAFARKEVRVQFPTGDGPGDMTEDEKTRIAAAVAEASSETPPRS